MSGTYQGSKKIEDEARRLELLAIISNEESERILTAIQQSGFRPKTIIDFGCGAGDAFPVFEQIFPDATVIGLDQSEKALARARQRNARVIVRQCDLTDMSKIAGEFKQVDLAYFRNVLVHLNDPLKILESGKKLLSPHGILFSQEADWNTAEANWADFTSFKTSLTAMMQSVGINPYIGKDLKNIFQKLSLSGVTVDISSRTVWPQDKTWEILNALLEVGGDRLNPYLQKNGIKNIDDMRARIDLARKTKDNYFKTPAWVIAYGENS